MVLFFIFTPVQQEQNSNKCFKIIAKTKILPYMKQSEN